MVTGVSRNEQPGDLEAGEGAHVTPIIMYSTSQMFGHTYSFQVFCRKVFCRKYILYLRFLKVTTLCLDDSFAHSWYSLNQLHEVDTRNAFQLICGISFLLNAFETISCVVTR